MIYNVILFNINNYNNNDSKNMNNKNLFSFLRNHSFVKVYEYLRDNRADIMKDHKINKSGVYILYNKMNSHYYVGSSINISGRMKNYLNIKYLELKQNNNMPIVKGLLKYGHNNFALIIIKYLPQSDLTIKESYWINELKPYYNVLLEAYRSTGYIHTEKTKLLLRNLALARTHSDHTKGLISLFTIGTGNPFYGKKHSLISKELISIKKSKGRVYIYDNLLNLQIVLSSVTELAKAIHANYSTINEILNKNKLFRGKWYIKSHLLIEDDLPLIDDKYSKRYVDLIEEMQQCIYIKQAIFMFNSKTKEFIRSFDGIIQAENELSIRHENIKNSIEKNIELNGYIFSYHRLLNLSY